MATTLRRMLPILTLTAIAVLSPATSHAGSIFLSGHDPDFHASLGNTTGAQNLINRSLEFVRNGSTAPILFLKTDTTNIALGDHLDSESGLVASGFTQSGAAGNHYVRVSASEFATADLSLFSAIFVPSDHGGTLTGNDLAALNARSSDIISYLNGGGGLVAWAEDGNHQPAVPGPEPALFGFLPFIVSSTGLSQGESGFTLSPLGVSLGLALSDINGNFSHNFFTGTGGMTPVDFDAANRIISLAFRGKIGPGGTVPEPSTVLLIVTTVVIFVLCSRRNRRR